MDRSLWVVLLAAFHALDATKGVVEGYPSEDLVVRLPGQPQVGFRQFAGYVDVDEKAGRSLFYYFAEAEGDAVHKRPLTLWLNGGPGCSSVGGGAFTELGPFFPRGDGRGLLRNKDSWNRVANLLFVESPAGVGWSYSNRSSDYIRGDHATAIDMRTFLLRWYEKFPVFKSRDLFLTGESYAGHYIPQLADALLNYNMRSSEFKFSLKGVAATKMSVGVDVCMTYERRFYFNLPEVQQALHANRTNLPYEWSMCSEVVKYNYTDGNINMLPTLKRIIRSKIPVWIFSGDQDSVVPLLGSRTLVRELADDLGFKITVPYRAWFHKGQVGGWVTKYGKLLTFATVRGAAHMVPYATPGRALLLFKSFIDGHKLPNLSKPSID